MQGARCFDVGFKIRGVHGGPRSIGISSRLLSIDRSYLGRCAMTRQSLSIDRAVLGSSCVSLARRDPGKTAGAVSNCRVQFPRDLTSTFSKAAELRNDEMPWLDTDQT